MTLIEINQKIDEIFQNELYNTEKGVYVACEIFYTLSDPETEEHNCIGCNLAAMLNLIRRNLFVNLAPNEETEIEFYVTNVILWYYLIIERFETIYNLINTPQQKILSDFRHKNFSTFIKITKWANFIKHPKAFAFTHDATYCFEDDMIDYENKIEITTDFILNYYNGDSKNKELAELLANKSNVIVRYPNLINLTFGFCKDFKKFVDFITKNEIIKDFLRDKSTISQAFSNDSTLIQPSGT